jgi:diaminopimelate decarboxylase
MEKKFYERPIVRRLETGMPGKFGMRTDYPPTTQIDGISVNQLLEKYGSPLFVLSEDTIRTTYRRANRAFTTRYPKVQFAWSYKTNYLDSVCRVFHQEGSWAEVVSGFEYDKALSNGVDGKQIIFNGPGKSETELSKAIEHDSLIHIDHLDELYLLIETAAKIGKKPRVAIRVNMDTGIYPMWDRFGFNYENGQAWDAVSKIVASGKLELTGLHTHIGTFILTPNAYAVAATKLAELAVEIDRKFHVRIRYIDMGGGFASRNTLKGSYLPGPDVNPSFDDYAEAISTALLASNLDPANLPLLILETGRALIDEAGFLAGRVVANKRLTSGKRSTILDFGVNLLFTAFWYEHKITPTGDFSQYREDASFYGPLCMNIDVIRENISFPPLNAGDGVVAHSVGAYNMTQWMQFITTRPNIILIDTKGATHIVRENETLQSVTASERVPSHLV